MTPWLTVEAEGYSIAGQQRPENQDYLDFREPTDPGELTTAGRLYAVADGVGGRAQGKQASQQTVETVIETYYRLQTSDISQRLTQAFQQANHDIVSQPESEQRMATTLVAAVVCGDQLFVAHVGDSRAYLIRDGIVSRLTRDHSLMQALIDQGELTPEAARSFKRKNVILRSIGSHAGLEVDVSQHQLQPGDMILLCSDGLHQYFWEDDELLPFLAWDKSADQMALDLVEEANARGGSDNISALIIKVGGAAGPTLTTRRQRESEALTQPVAPPPVQPARTAAQRARHPRPSAPPSRGRLWLVIGFGIVMIGLALIGGLIVGRSLFANPTADQTTAPPPRPTAAESLPLETVVLAPTPTQPSPPTPAPTIAPTSTITFPVYCAWSVQSGDTVSVIASRSLSDTESDKFNERQQQIIQQNNIATLPNGEPNLLAGSTILVPWSDPATFDPQVPPTLDVQGQQYPDCREYLR